MVSGCVDAVRQSVLRGFFGANRHMCESVEQLLPYAQRGPSTVFSNTSTEAVSWLKSGAIVLDVGAGRRSVLAGVAQTGIRVVAVDSASDELAAAAGIDELLVADVCHRIPLGDRYDCFEIGHGALFRYRCFRPGVGQTAKTGWPVCLSLFLPVRAICLAEPHYAARCGSQVIEVSGCGGGRHLAVSRKVRQVLAVSVLQVTETFCSEGGFHLHKLLWCALFEFFPCILGECSFRVAHHVRGVYRSCCLRGYRRAQVGLELRVRLSKCLVASTACLPTALTLW